MQWAPMWPPYLNTWLLSLPTAICTRLSEWVLNRCNSKSRLIISAANRRFLVNGGTNTNIARSSVDFAWNFILTSDVIAISCGTSTGAENVGCQLVKLLAVLVSNDWASCGSGIGSEGNTSLKSKQRDIDISNPFSSVWLLVHPLNKIYMSSSHVAAAAVLTLKIAPQIVVPVLVKLILGFIFA